MKYILAITILFFVGQQGNAQFSKSKIATRPVIIKYAETTIKANIINNKVNRNTLDNIVYTWYSQEDIHQNTGGYSGYLLHGVYEEFDLNNNLIQKGNYYFGMKQGTWKEWYAKGMIKEISYWEQGIKNGKLILYNPDGSIKQETEYKNNQKDGKEIIYMGNKEIIKTFKNGEEQIENKEKKQKKEFRLFNKKDKKLNDGKLKKEKKNDGDKAKSGKKYEKATVKKKTERNFPPFLTPWKLNSKKDTSDTRTSNSTESGKKKKFQLFSRSKKDDTKKNDKAKEKKNNP